MQIGRFKAFEKNSGGSRLWASWHSPHSLTWRWTARVSRRDRITKFFMFRHDKHNAGRNIHLLAGPLTFHVSTQRPMWYRDLYMRRRDDDDRASYQAWQAETMTSEHGSPSRAFH